MNSLLAASTFFGVAITLLTYQFGQWIKRRFKSAIFNPLLLSILMIIVILVVGHVDYDTYYEGARYLSYFLTPATVCLAVPLYEQFELLKKNGIAIMAGIIAGVLTTMLSVLVFAILFHFNHEQYVTLLPKSVTTAIGMGVSEELGGVVTITIAAIVVTGIFGNMIAESMCRIFKIKEPVARGIAIGSASHAMGTAKAIEMGEIEGAMSSLSIAVSGLLTVVAASIFANFI